jgi:NAD(P)-dependent dehydrogenase (short-subunit alcohol dehydrogenase family)
MKILITGADRGLGYGTTLRLLERGHTVWAGQYLTAWNELSELQTRFPKTLHILELDVSDLDSVRAAAQLVGSQTDSLDMIINNAGISGRPIPRTGEPPVGGRPTRETVVLQIRKRGWNRIIMPSVPPTRSTRSGRPAWWSASCHC